MPESQLLRASLVVDVTLFVVIGLLDGTRFRQKSRRDQRTEVFSFFFLLAVPAFYAALTEAVLGRLPGRTVLLHLHPAVTFLLGLVGMDYAWYWNHRAMHRWTPLRRMHLLHHEATVMDVWVTKRNSIPALLSLVYFWLALPAATLFDHPDWFLAGPFLFTMPWLYFCHTRLENRLPRVWRERLGAVLILPVHHNWHHTPEGADRNLGGIFSLWDRIHGTWLAADAFPQAYGPPTDRTRLNPPSDCSSG